MELIFTKTNNDYIAEFHANKYFNIHIEGVTQAKLYHKTSGSEWDYVTNINDDFSDIIDTDVAVNIPKDFKITTDNMPTMAVVTINEEDE